MIYSFETIYNTRKTLRILYCDWRRVNDININFLWIKRKSVKNPKNDNNISDQVMLRHEWLILIGWLQKPELWLEESKWHGHKFPLDQEKISRNPKNDNNISDQVMLRHEWLILIGWLQKPFSRKKFIHSLYLKASKRRKSKYKTQNWKKPRQKTCNNYYLCIWFSRVFFFNSRAPIFTDMNKWKWKDKKIHYGFEG